MRALRRLSVLLAVAMMTGVVGAAIPALPAAAVTATDVTENFISGASLPFGVAVVSVDSSHIYWGNAGTDTIGRANLDGSSPDESFIVTSGSPGSEATNGVAVRGNLIYWANQFTGKVGRATLNGDGPATNIDTNFILGGNQTTRVVVNANFIYWANNGNNTIGRANLDGTGVDQDFIDTGAAPVGLTVDSNFIYWANQNGNTLGRANLNGTGVDNSFITTDVTMPAGVAVDSGHVYWANVSANTLNVANLDGSSPQVLISGANSPRGVAVDSNFLYWANNGDGTIGRATLLDVPGAPTIGTASPGVGSGSVTFTPPGDDGGSMITGYTATCTSGGGATGTGTGSGSPISVSGLTSGATYTCVVTATNAIGTGAPSAPSNSFVVPTVPDAPTIGTATAGNASGSVTFTPPTNNGGSSVTSYTVTCTPGTGTTGTATGGGSPILVSGLTNGATYTCTVVATNAVGPSAPSASSNPFVPATLAGAPTIGTATAGNASGSVTFTAPTNTGGSSVTSYTVTCTSGTGTTGTATGGGSPILVSGLTNGATYTCTVVATNAVGPSPASAPSNSFVPVTVPAPPTIGSASPATGAVVVTFTPPANNGGSPITGFTAACMSLAGNPTVSASGSGSPITVPGLVDGTPYQCAVTATNAVGPSLPSGVTSVALPAGFSNCNGTMTAPSNVSSAPGPGNAVVSWAPSVPNPGCVAGYVVTPYLGSVAQLATLVPGNGTTTVISGLVNGLTYRFTVTAEDGHLLSPVSAFSATVTVGVPSAATALHVTRVGKGSLKVSFATARSNGSPIKSYTATCRSSNGGRTKAKTANAGPVIVTGLSASKTYTCVVKATNSRGTGPASHASNAVRA